MECPYDPFDPAVIEEPQAFFAWLRQHAPVYELPNGAYTLVSRFDDVCAAALDTETFSSNLVTVLQAGQGDEAPGVLSFGGDAPRATDVLAIADPPAHSRQRQISNRSFTRRRVEAMQADIETLTEQLIDGWIDESAVDWVSALAVPLPMTIIVRLLGLPEEDLAQLKRWSDASVQLLSGVNTPDELQQLNGEIAAMFAYLGQQLRLAADSGASNVMADLMSDSGFGLDEVTSILVQLLTAGNETTTSLIGSALRLLLQTPGLQQRLRDEPDLIDAFVEEALRLESPFHGHFRVTTRDCELSGVKLEKGRRLMLLWSSANRDATVFDAPDAVDVSRKRPRAHVAFGHGIHQCIGAALARMEAQCAIRILLQRTKDIRLAPGNDFRHVPSLFTRGLQRLDISFDAA
jgi:cytochrome P450